MQPFLQPFVNNLTMSALFVSPAQLYQRQEPVAHADLARARFDGRIESDDVEHQIDVEGGQGTFIALAPLGATAARVALIACRQELRTTVRTEASAPLVSGSGALAIESHEQGVGPALSYDFGERLSVGATLAIVDAGEETEGTSGSASFHYTTLTPGVTYHPPGFELGVVYRPQVGLREADGAKLVAGSLVVHTQVRATERLAVGGSFEHVREAALDDEASKNNFKATLAGELDATAALMVGGSFTYESMAAKYESGKTPYNVSSATFTLYADHAVGPEKAGAVGALVGYARTGEQSGELEIGSAVQPTKIELEGVSLALAGSVFL